jgi:hypothetical protein
VLSNAKWEILQVFPGVNKVSVVKHQVGDFVGIPWDTQGQCCLTPALDNTDLVYPSIYLQNLPLGVR